MCNFKHKMSLYIPILYHHEHDNILVVSRSSGQSYKASTIVNYDSRVEPRVVIYERKMFIILATEGREHSHTL